MSMEFLVGLILVLVAFMIIGGSLMRFMAKAEPKEAEILCHDSILLRARTQTNIDATLVGAKIKPVPVMCKTIDLKISGTREELLSKVAYAMARCWWMFGEGRHEEILHGSDIKFLPAVFGMEETKNQCFNCYTLMIDQDEIDGGPIGGAEILDYLYKEKHPKFKNATYLDYIQSYGGPGRVVFTAPAIFPREAYSISMMPKNKEDSWWEGLGEYIKGGLSILVDVVEGVVSVIAIAATVGTATPLVIAKAGAKTAIKAAIKAAAKSAVKVAAKTVKTTGKIALKTTKFAVKHPILSGATAYTAYKAYNKAMESLYAERDVSSIYFGFLEVGQKHCGSGDLAGE